MKARAHVMVYSGGRSLDDLGQSISYDDALALFLYAPKDSHVHSEMVGLGDASGWGLSEWLVAELIDELRGFFTALGGNKGGPPPRISRPGVDEQQSSKESTIETAAISVDDIERFMRVKRE